MLYFRYNFIDIHLFLVYGKYSTPSAPYYYKLSGSSISVYNYASGECEYSLDGINWQDSDTFNGLTPETEYKIYARVKESDYYYASDVSEPLVVKTLAGDDDPYDPYPYYPDDPDDPYYPDNPYPDYPDGDEDFDGQNGVKRQRLDFEDGASFYNDQEIFDYRTNGVYKVISFKKNNMGYVASGELSYIRPINNTVKSIVIKDTLSLHDVRFKITQIATSACKGCKIKSLTIGKNVNKIGGKAFYNCKKLKKIRIKTTKLKKKSIGKNAFKGLSSKATIKVPAKKLKTYKSILKKAGFKGGKRKIKK